MTNLPERAYRSTIASSHLSFKRQQSARICRIRCFTYLFPRSLRWIRIHDTFYVRHLANVWVNDLRYWTYMICLNNERAVFYHCEKSGKNDRENLNEKVHIALSCAKHQQLQRTQSTLCDRIGMVYKKLPKYILRSDLHKHVIKLGNWLNWLKCSTS